MNVTTIIGTSIEIDNSPGCFKQFETNLLFSLKSGDILTHKNGLNFKILGVAPVGEQQGFCHCCKRLDPETIVIWGCKNNQEEVMFAKSLENFKL
ncbi:hypothetical protein KKH36_01380 [Patescibacteria group bacterium]|nr:hypothetical protein [Patescibacteria group bacterium]